MGSIETHWYVDQRVRLLTAAGHLELDMVKAYDEETRRVYDACPSSIHVIADVRNVKGIPPLSECLRMSSLWHKRLALFVTVGAMQQPITRFIFTAVTTIARLNYRDLTTIEEAQYYLLACDPSLPPLSLWSLPPTDKGASKSRL